MLVNIETNMKSSEYVTIVISPPFAYGEGANRLRWLILYGYIIALLFYCVNKSEWNTPPAFFIVMWELPSVPQAAVFLFWELPLQQAVSRLIRFLFLLNKPQSLYNKACRPLP